MFHLVHLAALTATILVLSRVLPGFRIQNAWTALTVAVVFSVLNVLLGWLVWALLLVPALFTFGLLFVVVPFIVNTFFIWLTDKILDSFEIDNTATLLLASGGITLVNSLFHASQPSHAFHKSVIF